MRRIARYILLPLLLFLLGTAWAQERQVFRINSQAQWEDWDIPPSLLDFDEDGSFTPVKFDNNINAALNATRFVHAAAGNTEVQGGVWRVGSNANERGISPDNIIDGDPQTYWKPDPNADIKDWWIEVNLGRLVPVTKIRIVFPDTTGARPLREFRVYGSRGFRKSASQNLFAFDVLGGTSRFNTETELEYELSPWRELTERVVETGFSGTTEIDFPSFQALQFIRIRGDSQTPDAALAEIEIMTLGENVSLHAKPRGGDMYPTTGRGTAMIDGDQNSSWAQSIASNDDVIWVLDLGARYWVKNVLFLGAEARGSHTGDLVADHLLLSSDEGTRLNPEEGEVRFDIIHNFDTRLVPGGCCDVQYLMPNPLPLRYLAGLHKRTNGDMAELMVFPTGYLAGVELQSGFIDLGEFAGDGNFKQILDVSWDADIPEGTSLQLQTRTGFKLTRQINYFKKDGTPLADSAEYFDTNKFLRGDTDTLIVAGSDWSAWSSEYSESGLFLSPSPRRLLQIQMRLTSERLDAVPTLKSLEIGFTNALVKGIEGEIDPKQAQPGIAETFTYKIWGDFAAGDNFDQLLLQTPSHIDPDSLQVKVGGIEIADFTWQQNSDDSLLIQLPQAIDQIQDTVEVRLRLQIDRNPTMFNAFVSRTQTPDLWQEVRPNQSVGRANQVFFPSVPRTDQLLSNLTVSPQVATPNGDGANDQAQIRFLVLNVEVDPEVWIYSLDGRPVRQLQGGRGPDGFHVYNWPGTDAADQLAVPGIYLCKIHLKTQLDEQEITRTIGLAY